MLSKYAQVYQNLKEKIENNEIKANSYLPSEKELMASFSCSRDTIRKALNLLNQNGYIQKSQGKGSLVLDCHKVAFPISGLTSFQELAKAMHTNVKTQVVVLEKIPASEKIKKELFIEQGEVYHLERIRNIDGENVILDIDYLNAGIIPDLTEEIARNSLYDYIENQLKLKISFAKKEITVVPATKKDQQLLDLAGYDLLVCVTSYVYLEDASLFQYTMSKHRPDKFRFVEFARRAQL